MNVATISENKPPFLTALFQRWLPTRPSAQAMFWASFPIFLLLLNMGVSWLKPTPFALYLPFVALVACSLVLRYKALGVSISYITLGLMLFWLIPAIEPSERLWQMGIFLNLALTLYITLLTCEEVERCFVEVQESVETHHTSASEMASELRVLKSQAEEKQQELEVEIQKLKSEAEHRRIERNQLQGRFELIQSEIELLNTQKDTFINDAREARSAAVAAEQQMLLERSQVEQERSELKLEGSQVEQSELKLQALHAQLEQAQTAVRTTQELLHTWKNRVSQAEEALQQTNNRLAEGQEHKKHWEASFAEWQIQRAQLEKTNGQLRDQLHAEVISAQEAILILQQKPPAIIEIEKHNVEKPIVSSEDHSEKVELLQKALNKAQGLHIQLQSQFQDKSDVLSQTRRELFATQGRLETIEKEALNMGLIPEREEARVLENAVTALTVEIALLEDEIVRLESLITALFSPT